MVWSLLGDILLLLALIWFGFAVNSVVYHRHLTHRSVQLQAPTVARSSMRTRRLSKQHNGGSSKCWFPSWLPNRITASLNSDAAGAASLSMARRSGGPPQGTRYPTNKWPSAAALVSGQNMGTRPTAFPAPSIA